jgi:hypothetical protein
VVRRDHEYWRGRVDGMIGDWLTEATSVQAVADFVEKVYVRKDLGGFHGDPRFIQNAYAQKFFSKLRSSLGGLYTWRMNHAADAAEKERMAREADFAFRGSHLPVCGFPEKPGPGSGRKFGNGNRGEVSPGCGAGQPEVT